MFARNIFELFLWFMIYSFIGWVWEEIVCGIKAKKLLNRGFMSGPYCPVYGFGALIYIWLMHFLDTPVEMFFIGGVLACTLEYFTSYIMEKLFKARWWNYSNRFLNINGRVCFIGFIAFATFAALMPSIHTLIYNMTSSWPTSLINIIAIVLMIAILSDLATTVESVLKLNNALKDYEAALEKNSVVRFLQRSRRGFEMRISEFQKRHKILGYEQRRMFRAFPNFSSQYSAAFEQFRKMNLENAQLVKASKKIKKDIKKSNKKAAKKDKKAAKKSK